MFKKPISFLTSWLQVCTRVHPWPAMEMLGQTTSVLTRTGYQDTRLPAGAMTWASYVFATKPDVQDKLRAEIMELLARKPIPDYSDVECMKYMQNFSASCSGSTVQVCNFA